MEVESRARELALPDTHLNVTFAQNGSAIGDAHVFQLAHASAQVAADPCRVSQRKATSGHGQIAADSAADIGIASEDGRAALHLALQANVASAHHDTFAHLCPVIYAQEIGRASCRERV